MGDRARASMNCYNKNTVEEVLQELEDALTDTVETGREKSRKERTCEDRLQMWETEFGALPGAAHTSQIKGHFFWARGNFHFFQKEKIS